MEDMTKDISKAIEGLQQGKVVRVYVDGDMLKVKEVLQSENSSQVRILQRGRESVIDLPEDYAFAIYEAL